MTNMQGVSVRLDVVDDAALRMSDAGQLIDLPEEIVYGVAFKEPNHLNGLYSGEQFSYQLAGGLGSVYEVASSSPALARNAAELMRRAVAHFAEIDRGGAKVVTDLQHEVDQAVPRS